MHSELEKRLISNVKDLLNMGRLDEADGLCVAAITESPRSAVPLNLRGVIAGQRGANDAAVAFIQQALVLDDGFFDAQHNLGCVLRNLGRLNEALEAHRRAVQLSPGSAEGHLRYGIALTATGKWAEAESEFRLARRLQPGLVSAMLHLGVALEQQGRGEEAAGVYGEAIESAPRQFEAHFNLGNVLTRLGRVGEAVECYRRALKLNPGFAAASINLGNGLKALGLRDEAMRMFGSVLEKEPAHAEANHNLAVCLRESGEVGAAIIAWRRAVAARPDYADAHFGLGMALLLVGELREGWTEYEWRHRRVPPDMRRSELPTWDGSTLTGQTVLVHAEQGLGDTIQFARFLPEVKSRGGRAIFECDQRLISLFRMTAELADIEMIARDADRPVASAGLDLQLPLMSFPLILGIDAVPEIPKAQGYLAVDAEAYARAARILGDRSGFRVGLVWAGSSENGNDFRRSIRLEALTPLKRANASFFSLQTGEAASQAKESTALQPSDLSEYLSDFAATAAFIAHMDLVISVDTAVAHLAGALGRPVWMLTPFAPDFRWLLERHDTPWYSSMRLFRQEREGEWAAPISEMATALSGLE